MAIIATVDRPPSDSSLQLDIEHKSNMESQQSEAH